MFLRSAFLAAILGLTGLLAEAHASPRRMKRDAPPAEAAARAQKYSASELHEQLAQFYTFFVNSLDGASARAALGEPDLEKREQLTLIKIRAARACRTAVFQSDPLAGYIDTLALCLQMRALADSQKATNQLAADAAEFTAITAKLDAEITLLGEHFLDPQAIDALHTRLEEFAKNHPIGASRPIIPPSDDFDVSIPGLSWLLELPLAPFRAMQGVDNTAGAITNFNGVANGFSRTVAQLPLELAWEGQLLVLQANRGGETAGRALIDHAALRVAQLAVGIFGLALLWSIITARLRRTRP